MRRLLSALALFCAAAPLAAEDPCVLCDLPRPGAEEPPLTIEIASGLVFSRLALSGDTGGSAAIDPLTGARSIVGGLVGLGGISVQGRGRITGAPGRSIRVDLPATVAMSTTGGGNAELTDLVTDLPAFPVLDATGSLDFGFGGTLRLSGAASGKLRGRIAISVDYN